MRDGTVEEQEAQEDLINVWKYLKGVCKEDTARVCSVVLNETRGNGQNLKHKRFSLNIRSDTASVRVTKHWHMLPSESVESPFSDFPRAQHELCAVADLGLSSGVGVADVQQHL